MSRQRDPARTRQRILDAGLREFSAKGFAGARVDAITRAARVNRRMLYHYFGSKAGLFREIQQQKMAWRATLRAATPLDPALSLPLWFEFAQSDTDWLRLLQWEALDGRGRRVVAEVERSNSYAESTAFVREQQHAGMMPSDLDPELLLLALAGISTFSSAFPQVTRLVTGRAPNNPEFQVRQKAFLRRLGEILRTSADDASRPPTRAIRARPKTSSRRTSR